MRSVSLTGLRQLSLGEIPPPRLSRPDEVLIRVGAVGVCGSDVHYYTHGRIGSQVIVPPFRVGHEFAGTVIETGSAVQRLQPGDRVAVDPAMPCFACDQCRTGRHHTCRALRFLGCPGQAEGCLCDQIVMPESSCFSVPTGFSMELAALVEPVSIGCYAVRLSGALSGKRLVIQGCGPIGLSVLLAARGAGAAAILSTDPLAPRQALARELGADWSGPPEALAEALGGEAPQVIFECCGEQAALDQAIDCLCPGGLLLLIGIPVTDRVSFSIDRMRRAELAIQNVRRQNDCVPAAIDLLAGPMGADALKLVTHRFDVAETAAAFEQVAAYGDGVVKAMITFGPQA